MRKCSIYQKVLRTIMLLSVEKTSMTNPLKRYNAKMQYLPKSTTNNYVIISGKNFYDQPIDSDIK